MSKDEYAAGILGGLAVGMVAQQMRRDARGMVCEAWSQRNREGVDEWGQKRTRVVYQLPSVGPHNHQCPDCCRIWGCPLGSICAVGGAIQRICRGCGQARAYAEREEGT